MRPVLGVQINHQKQNNYCSTTDRVATPNQLRVSVRQYVYTSCKHTHTSTFWVVETPILEMYRIINRFRFTFSVGQLAPSTGRQAPYTLNTARNLKGLHFDTRITSLDTIRKDRSIRTTTYISSYNLVVIIPLTIFEKTHINWKYADCSRTIDYSR